MNLEAAPLLRKLEFPKTTSQEPVIPDKRHVLLLRKLGHALEQGLDEISIEAKDLTEIESEDVPPLPDAFAASLTLAASSERAIADGDFQVVLRAASGPSGATMMGRFCRDDDAMHQQVVRHLHAEESLYPGAIFAEVVHLPGQKRIGNVLQRCLLRKYEIPFLGQSGTVPECQIPITDLRVSVVNDRVILRSERLGCEIIPRLTSAHNYDHPLNLGLYRFLCGLQRQGVSFWLAWEWGVFENLPFLPRVRAGRLVLSLACWSIDKNEARSLDKEDDNQRFLAVRKWRSERKLPRFVGLLHGDNKLLIDLDNALCVDTIIEQLNKDGGGVLEEIYPQPNELVSIGPEGHYVHEMIVPFVRVRETTRSGPCLMAKTLPRSVRTFSPGSEWLYLKLYTGNTTADELLRMLISPFVTASMRSGAVKSWFFVRYGDPDWHLRLRLHGSPKKLCERLLPSLHSAINPFLEDGRLWRMQLDTYEREVERYGGIEATMLAEQLFHVDSEAVLDIVKMYQGDEGAEARWRLALHGVDLLLSDLRFNLETKSRVVAGLRKALVKEFRGDGKLKLQDGFAALHRRSERLVSIIDPLVEFAENGQLVKSLEEIAASYLHMFLNRILRSAHREHELVLYDFLARLYDSRAKRA